MKKGMTVEDYMKELDFQRERANVFSRIISRIDDDLKWMCDRETDAESYYEDIVNEETGETERKWHAAVYKVDENGDYIWIEPSEGDYNYDSYTALKKVREEIMAII